MNWEEVPIVVDTWYGQVKSAHDSIRPAAATLFPATPIGYYANPVSGGLAVYAPEAGTADRALAKSAASLSGTPPLFLSYQELADPSATWVKVAYSPSLRATGEALNFFPGQYPGGLPNSPSPLAAMLTTGLLGAGLGWAGGKALGAALPSGYGDNLGRTGALAGAILGAAPGLAWGGVNRADGRPFNDPSLLSTDGGEYPAAADGANSLHFDPPADPGAPLRSLLGSGHAHVPRGWKFAADLALGDRYTTATEKAASTFGQYDGVSPSAVDVNVNALGHTLWESGASPALTATTLGAMYAAQQMPDPRARPGWVTGNQLGHLAANAGSDYATGLLAGAAINLTVGSPIRPSTVGAGNAVLGVLGAVVPKLFGG